MAEYLSPGVYVEQVSDGSTATQGISASTAAFVGLAPRGVRNDPFLVTSWEEFKTKTSRGLSSPFLTNAYLAYQVFGFFNNGGKRAWIVLSGDGTQAKAKVDYVTGLTFTALEEGAWGNLVKVNITSAGAGFWNIIVKYNGVVMKTYSKLPIASFASAINGIDPYITVTVTGTPTVTASGEKALAGGIDGFTVTDANLGDSMRTLDQVEEVNLLVIAESQSQAMVLDALAYCDSRKDAFLVADGGINDSFESIQTFASAFASDNGGLFYPWIEVTDPLIKVGKRSKFIPSAGHVAGEIARTDENRGVFKSPAGTEATLNGVLSLRTKVTSAQQDVLNPLGINIIRSFSDTGVIVWGAKTMLGNYINVQRELRYVMNLIFKNTRWAVFEPNNAELWRKISNQIYTLLYDRWQQGAYFGDTVDQAFMVKCDEELNTKEIRDSGKVITNVGVAVNKPGEFVVFEVGQWDGGGFVG